MNLSFRMWLAMEEVVKGPTFYWPQNRTWGAIERRGLAELIDVNLGSLGTGLKWTLTEKGKAVWAARPDWMRK